MTELLTAAQMRAIEQAAIASGEVTGLELMERAGRGVVEAILEWRPELAETSHRAVVLCGPGNNGGDGFVVARLLKERGWAVEVFLYGDEAKLPPDAAENARRWREMGEILPIDTDAELRNQTDLLVDALFGIGLRAGLPRSVEEFFNRIPYRLIQNARWAAIDLPSDCCADSGHLIRNSENEVAGFRLRADLTVTFHTPKVGHALSEGPEHCGALRVVDIGIEFADTAKLWPANADVLTAKPVRARIASVLPASLGRDGDHKYSHGHALILSGGPGAGGAARLAARGALRIGAGLVTVGCPPEALVENAARLDAIMLAALKGVDGLQAELRARKIKAVCIGPGFGLGDRLREFVQALLTGEVTGVASDQTVSPAAPLGGRSASPGGRALPSDHSSEAADSGAIENGDARMKPDRRQDLSVVLDADALTEYAQDPETLFAMLHERCVLTPHEGEFGRLFPDILAKLKAPATKGPAYSRVDATREAAKRAGCVVLFKGPDTVIAHPDGRCAINSAHYDRAAPWLATAGSGDVLAGFITGLLARGFDPMSAAETATWLHVECARKFGPGLIAEDLPEQLPVVFRDLGVA
ncbi:MAG: NAD(P)H-hydrate epimerase [Pseudomonadota bacterium]